MTHRLAVIVLFGALAICATASVADPQQSRVVLVTLDGVRWQDVFRGADPQLSVDDRFVSWREEIARKFLDVADRPAALTPFLHAVVAKRGVLIGNRDSASCAEVTNPYWFSYPGYNEILTGHADPAVNSNDKRDKTQAEVITGSNQTWIAAIGPVVGPLASAGCAHSDQIAATMLVALGEDWRGFSATIGASLFAVPASAQRR